MFSKCAACLRFSRFPKFQNKRNVGQSSPTQCRDRRSVALGRCCFGVRARVCVFGNVRSLFVSLDVLRVLAVTADMLHMHALEVRIDPTRVFFPLFFNRRQRGVSCATV